MHRGLHLEHHNTRPDIQPKHRCCMDHNSVEECQCGELQLTKEEMVVVGTWLGVGTYHDRKSWRIKLLKDYRVWRAFVAAQRQRQRPGSSWLVLRAPADVGTWPHSYIIEAHVFVLFKLFLASLCDSSQTPDFVSGMCRSSAAVIAHA